MAKATLRKDGDRLICSTHGAVSVITLRNRNGRGRQFCLECFADYLGTLPIACRAPDHVDYPSAVECHWEFPDKDQPSRYEREPHKP